VLIVIIVTFVRIDISYLTNNASNALKNVVIALNNLIIVLHVLTPTKRLLEVSASVKKNIFKMEIVVSSAQHYVNNVPHNLIVNNVSLVLKSSSKIINVNAKSDIF